MSDETSAIKLDEARIPDDEIDADGTCGSTIALFSLAESLVLKSSGEGAVLPPLLSVVLLLLLPRLRLCPPVFAGADSLAPSPWLRARAIPSPVTTVLQRLRGGSAGAGSDNDAAISCIAGWRVASLLLWLA